MTTPSTERTPTPRTYDSITTSDPGAALALEWMRHLGHATPEPGHYNLLELVYAHSKAVVLYEPGERLWRGYRSDAGNSAETVYQGEHGTLTLRISHPWLAGGGQYALLILSLPKSGKDVLWISLKHQDGLWVLSRAPRVRKGGVAALSDCTPTLYKDDPVPTCILLARTLCVVPPSPP